MIISAMTTTSTTTTIYVLTTITLMTFVVTRLGRKDFESIVNDHKLKNQKREAKEKADKNLRKKAMWTADLYDNIPYDDENALASMLGAVILPENVSTENDLSTDQYNSFPKPAARLLQSSPPESLDLRTAFPNCVSLKTIYNQGNCASCWAFAAANIATDQYCIEKNINRTFSPNDLLTCCPDCAAVKSNGCKGGYLTKAFNFVKANGLSTGGAFNDRKLCKPYFLNPRVLGSPPAPACSETCANSKVSDDKMKISAFNMVSGEVNMIAQLLSRGSIVASMAVYADLYTYKNGIYKSNMLKLVGVHAVRIVGYGVDPESGTKYWLIANTWGASFGEEGYFRLERGINNCYIEIYPTYSVTFA
jgi:cathepsin B